MGCNAGSDARQEITAGVEKILPLPGNSWNYFPVVLTSWMLLKASGLSLELKMFPQLPDAANETCTYVLLCSLV